MRKPFTAHDGLQLGTSSTPIGPGIGKSFAQLAITSGEAADGSCCRKSSTPAPDPPYICLAKTGLRDRRRFGQRLFLCGWQRRTARQRKEPVTSAGFLAGQFHESCSRSAAVRVGRQSTQRSPWLRWSRTTVPHWKRTFDDETASSRRRATGFRTSLRHAFGTVL